MNSTSVCKIYLEVISSLIESVQAVPHCGEEATEARVANTLEEKKLHGALVPPQHLLNTPSKAGGLVGTPGKNLSGFIHIQTSPPLQKTFPRKGGPKSYEAEGSVSCKSKTVDHIGDEHNRVMKQTVMRDTFACS